jgi:hypothetical protein
MNDLTYSNPAGLNAAGEGAFLPGPGTLEPTPDLSDIADRLRAIADEWTTPQLRASAAAVSRAHIRRREARLMAQSASDQYEAALGDVDCTLDRVQLAYVQAHALEAVADALPAPSLDPGALKDALTAAEKRVAKAELHMPDLKPLAYDQDRAAWERGRRVTAHLTPDVPPVALVSDLRASELRRATATKLSSLRSSISMWQNTRGTDQITRLGTAPGLVTALEDIRTEIDRTNEAVVTANVARREEFAA